MTARTRPLLQTIVAVAGSCFVGLLAVMLALIFWHGPSYSPPSGLRAPAGPVETEFVQRMSQEGHEVAFFSEGRVSVLVREAEWADLGRRGRFERNRFLSNCKATLTALQQERGDKAPYMLSIKSQGQQRLLAEETEFNPKFYEVP